MTPLEILSLAGLAALLLALAGWFLGRQTGRGPIILAEHQAEESEHRARQLAEELASLRQHLESLTGSHNELQLEHERLQERFQAQRQRLEDRDAQLERDRQQLSELEKQRQQLRERIETLRTEAEGARVRADNAEQARQTQQERQQNLETDLEEAQDARQQAERRLSELGARLEEQQIQNRKAREQLEENKQAMKTEFHNLANEIFEAKGKTFSHTSREQLDSLLKPFREQVNQFRQRVEEIHGNETQQRAQLTAELGVLKQLNRQITEEAHQLTTALKGQKKTQGNWGELVLENVLDRSGLLRDQDYRREVSFDTESGRQRPDVIVYLPQKRHLIIDAKVSLNAYTRYINSEEEGERRQALKEHVNAVSSRIRELSDRSYFELRELNSPEMVFMFIPVESAFVEALKAEPQLFEQAIQQNVLVATPTTLLTSLNIVRQLWRFEDQNKHSAELAQRAGRVYAKLNSFLGSMNELGKRLDRAADSYRNAMSQLVDGRGNLVRQVSEFKSLGVAVKQELPEELVERAALELPRGSPEDETSSTLASHILDDSHTPDDPHTLDEDQQPPPVNTDSAGPEVDQK